MPTREIKLPLMSTGVSEEYKRKWEQLLDLIYEVSPMLHEPLSKGIIEKVEDGFVVIGFHKSNDFKKISVERKSEIIKEKAGLVFGPEYGIRFIFSDSAPPSEYTNVVDSGVEEVEIEEPVGEEFYRELKKNDPVVSNVIDIFKGKVVKKKRKQDKEQV